MQNNRFANFLGHLAVQMEAFFLFIYKIFAPVVIQPRFTHRYKIITLAKLQQFITIHRQILFHTAGVNSGHFVKRNIRVLKIIHFWDGFPVDGRQENMPYISINSPLQDLRDIIIKLFDVQVAVGVCEYQMRLI